MKIKSSLIFLLVISSLSCHQKVEINIENETKAILDLDAKAREYHFSKNTKAFVESFSKNFISLNKGKIEIPTYNNSYQKFDTYFKSVQFVKWDNKEAPIVRFSDDASIAYVAVNKVVIVEYENELGKKILDTTEFAWLSILKKENNQWKLDCIASTNK